MRSSSHSTYQRKMVGPMPGSRKLPDAVIVALIERSRTGMSLHVIAKDVGVSYDTLNRSLNGEYIRSYNWDKITEYVAALAEHTGVSL